MKNSILIDLREKALRQLSALSCVALFALTLGVDAYAQDDSAPSAPDNATAQSVAAATQAADSLEAEILNQVLDIDLLHEELESEPVYGRTAIELLDELEDKHYSRIVYDDNFSSSVFDKYLEVLDGSKLYFLQEDIERLNLYRYTLDDSLQEGDLEPAFAIYNLYQKRLLERIIYSIERVENHLEDMDFTIDESIVIDREDAPYAASVEELDELWRQRVKNSALSLKLTDIETEEIREKLSKRYRNQLSQITKTNNRDVFQSYMATVANSVDPHTSYFSPRDSENFNMNLRLSLQGIGAQLTAEDEYTKVVELIKGGPAERGNELKAGDKIIGIAQGEDGEMKDVIGLRLDDVVDQIRGEKGTVVRLNVIPAEGVGEAQSHVVSITRDTVKLEDQSAKKEVLEVTQNGEDYKIGVIQLPTFYFDFEAASAGEEDYKSSTRDVAVLIEELKAENVDAIVMDLRDNGGGSLNEANQLVGLFIDTGATVQIRYSGLRNGFVRSYGDGDPGLAYEGPLAVLVNRASASASEIFAGAIQDYQRGIVLGGRTFGKGTVQEIIPMDYGQVKLTRSKFYRVSGASTQNRGVLPDIYFPDRYDAFEEMGESDLTGALPWDTVRPTEFDTYFPIKEVLPELQARHEERAASDPDFIYLAEQIERSKEMRQREEISLNEETLRAERKANRRAEFDANNMRRFMKGLPLEVWDENVNDEEEAGVDVALEVDEAEDSAAEEERADPARENDSDTELASVEEEEEEEDDPLLVESGHILIDLAEMLDQPIAVSSVR